MSVLAHVVLGGSSRSEPAATQALAFILNSSPDIARAFLRMLREANIEFEPGHIKTELRHEDSQPDLTIHDGDGHVRVFVENKFWAGLTDAQPVSYLRDLPNDPPSALVFVVPEQRVSTVWNELKMRCSQAELKWADASIKRTLLWTRVGCKTMMITSWKYVLEGLLDVTRSGGHDTISQDILQLQGLTSRMDAEAFLPLRSDEVTNQGAAHRLINYSELIEDITQKLKASGVADTSGLSTSHSYYTAGRHLRLYGKFGLWLGIDLKVWRNAGITPMWGAVGNDEFFDVAGHFETVRELFDDVQIHEDYVYIPIHLKTGVERDRVVEEAVAQINQIANKLRDTFPDN